MYEYVMEMYLTHFFLENLKTWYWMYFTHVTTLAREYEFTFKSVKLAGRLKNDCQHSFPGTRTRLLINGVIHVVLTKIKF